jgi:YHS domain-containing protein
MKPLILIGALFCVLWQAGAQTPTAETNLRKKHFWLDKKGVALQGYDPVSYFSGKPLEGKKEFVVIHKGIVYRFATDKNKQLFLAKPDAYEPAYGGWCAYAVGAKSSKVEPDPENFKIVDGKVNLFYKDFFGNTLNDWNEDEKALKTKAVENWSVKIYK